MGNNDKNPFESGLEDLKEIIGKISEKNAEGIENIKEGLEGVLAKLEEGLEKVKEGVPDDVKEAVQTNIETMNQAYAAGMTPTAPGEAPAVGIPSDEPAEPVDIPTPKELFETSVETMTQAYAAGMMPATPGEGPAVGEPSDDENDVPEIVKDIADAPEKIKEGIENLKEDIEEAAKANIETMNQAYAAGMTPTAPGEAPAVGIPTDEEIDPLKGIKETMDTFTETYESGILPNLPDSGIKLPEE